MKEWILKSPEAPIPELRDAVFASLDHLLLGKDAHVKELEVKNSLLLDTVAEYEAGQVDLVAQVPRDLKEAEMCALQNLMDEEAAAAPKYEPTEINGVPVVFIVRDRSTGSTFRRELDDLRVNDAKYHPKQHKWYSAVDNPKLDVLRVLFPRTPNPPREATPLPAAALNTPASALGYAAASSHAASFVGPGATAPAALPLTATPNAHRCALPAEPPSIWASPPPASSPAPPQWSDVDGQLRLGPRPRWSCETGGLGDCMYTSVAHQLPGATAASVREDAWRQLTAGAGTYSQFFSANDPEYGHHDSWESWIAAIRLPGEWGNHAVLQALSDLYGNQITVVNHTPSRAVLTPSSSTCRAQDLFGRIDPPPGGLVLAHLPGDYTGHYRGTTALRGSEAAAAEAAELAGRAADLAEGAEDLRLDAAIAAREAHGDAAAVDEGPALFGLDWKAAGAEAAAAQAAGSAEGAAEAAAAHTDGAGQAAAAGAAAEAAAESAEEARRHELSLEAAAEAALPGAAATGAPAVKTEPGAAAQAAPAPAAAAAHQEEEGGDDELEDLTAPAAPAAPLPAAPHWESAALALAALGLKEAECGGRGWCGWLSLAAARQIGAAELIDGMIAAAPRLARGPAAGPGPEVRLGLIRAALTSAAGQPAGLGAALWFTAGLGGKLAALAAGSPLLVLYPGGLDWEHGQWQMDAYHATPPHYQQQAPAAAAAGGATLVHHSAVHWRAALPLAAGGPPTPAEPATSAAQERAGGGTKRGRGPAVKKAGAGRRHGRAAQKRRRTA